MIGALAPWALLIWFGAHLLLAIVESVHEDTEDRP